MIYLNQNESKCLAQKPLKWSQVIQPEIKVIFKLKASKNLFKRFLSTFWYEKMNLLVNNSCRTYNYIIKTRIAVGINIIFLLP